MDNKSELFLTKIGKTEGNNPSMHSKEHPQLHKVRIEGMLSRGSEIQRSIKSLPPIDLVKCTKTRTMSCREIGQLNK